MLSMAHPAIPILSGSLLAFALSTAHAADLPIPTTVEVVTPALQSPWSFAIAPYFWAAGLQGDIAEFGVPSVHVDASFSDIFKNLDFGAMAVSELRYNRFGLFTDLMYVKISGEAGTPDGVLATDASAGSKTMTFTALGEYRVLDGPKGNLDAMAGARLWWVDTELGFSGGALDGVSASEDRTWVDPMVGMKGRFDITPKFYVNGWAMAGGFGVSSDFDWDLLAAAGYQFNNSISAALGYRALGVNYSHEDFVFDVVQHGPIAGVVIRF